LSKTDVRKKQQKKVPPKLDIMFTDDTPHSAPQHVEVMVTTEEQGQGQAEEHRNSTISQTSAHNLLFNRFVF